MSKKRIDQHSQNAAGASLLVAAALVVSGCSIERFVNRVDQPGPYEVDADTAAVHESLWVSDLHSDSLLWNRDLTERGSFGHVDIPRLIDGQVDFFVASTVSKTPWGLNMESNSDKTDMLQANSFIQGWPSRTWSDLTERVLYQGEKLERFAAESGGTLRIIGTASQLQQLLDDQAKLPDGQALVGAMLATEGGQALAGDINNLERLYKAGFRMIGLVHFYDNKLGGSAHGERKGGLTKFGRLVIRQMESMGMLVDLAHASKALVDDVVAFAERPLVVSHTGAYGTCPGPRNLTDEQLRKITQGGGIIGVSMFEPAICELSYAEAARTIKYVIDVVGLEHVALGSDFDGAVAMPTDISGIALLTAELRKLGLTDEEVRGVMGKNIQRFLLANLPGGKPAAIEGSSTELAEPTATQ